MAASKESFWVADLAAMRALRLAETTEYSKAVWKAAWKVYLLVVCWVGSTVLLMAVEWVSRTVERMAVPMASHLAENSARNWVVMMDERWAGRKAKKRAE